MVPVLLGGVSHSAFHIAFTYPNCSDPVQQANVEACNREDVIQWLPIINIVEMKLLFLIAKLTVARSGTFQSSSKKETWEWDDDLRGAWRDRDTNDIFAHCSLISYFLDFKFSNCICLSELHPLIWFFFKNTFRKKKSIRKTTQNALAPSIFIILSIALKLGTPLLHTQAQNTLLQNFQFRSRSWDMNEKPPKTLFYPTRSALMKHNFFRRSKLKNL